VRVSIQRSSYPLWSLLLLVACTGTGWFGGQEGEDMGGDDTGGTTDTDRPDTASDSGTDTDTDTDSGDDSGSTDTAVGWYFGGPFTIDATDGGGLTDRCTGTQAIRGGPHLGDPLAGPASCTFAGALASAFPSGLGVTVAGAITGTVAAGTLTFESGASGEVLDWTGTYEDDTLTGTFTGSLTSGATTVTVTGTFSGVRD
jgi:hypothetical protein